MAIPRPFLIALLVLALLPVGCVRRGERAELRAVSRSDVSTPRTLGELTRAGATMASLVSTQSAIDAYTDGDLPGKTLGRARDVLERGSDTLPKRGWEVLVSQSRIAMAEADLALLSGPSGNSLEPALLSEASLGQTLTAKQLRLLGETHSDVDLDGPSKAAIEKLEGELDAIEKRTLQRAEQDKSWKVLAPLAKMEVTSPYGMRADPINPKKKKKKHRGVDFRGAVGDDVFAVGPGEVLLAGWGGATGNAVVIRHPGGYTSQYFHLSKVSMQAGATVKAGDKVGEVGATGRATGPHLHLHFSIEGEAVDPVPWLGKTITVKNP